MKLWSRLQKGETIEEEGRVYTPDMVLGAPRRGIKLTYCTDTRPVDALVECGKESDLLICEGMYGDLEKQGKAIEHKHMTMYEAAEVAARSQVRELWLTHYSPSLLYPEDYMKRVCKIFPNAYPGKDGKSKTLEFTDSENRG
jgi:ribonuclease Z